MSEKDLVITPQMRVPDGTAISARPSYLISLTEKNGSGKTAQIRRFISTDLPNMQPSFVQMKGFFCDADEATIITSFKQLINAIDKDSIIEIYFPWHSIFSIRSLVFKAK